MALIAIIAALPAGAPDPAGAATRPPPEVAPLSVTPEMTAWARQVIPREGGRLHRLVSLQSALRSRLRRRARAHRDDPDAIRTESARLAFRSGDGDCLAFAFLFVALARDAGLPVGFALEQDPGHVTGTGELRVRHRHITAWMASVGGRLAFDRAGWRADGGLRPISDAAALALLHSNRGARELLAGRPGAALPWLRRALGYDPRSSITWTNLGLALRRLGRPEAAATAYRRALRIEPGSPAARRNLEFLRATGPPPDRPPR